MSAIQWSQLALGAFHYLRYPLEYFLDSAVRLELQNIELWGVVPHLYPDDLDEADITRIRREIEARKLRVAVFCPEQVTYPFDIASSNQRLRSRSVRYLQDSIRLGAALGTGTVLICPGLSYMNEDPEIPFDNCRRSLEELVPVAERESVILVLETQSRHDCRFLNRAADQRRMLDAVGSPHLRAMIDLSQMTQYGDTIADNLNLLGDSIRHVHLTAAYSSNLDLALQGEELLRQHPNGRPLDTHIAYSAGNNPVVRYLKQLGNTGYSHSISLEICSRDCYFDPEHYAVEGLDLLRRELFNDQ